VSIGYSTIEALDAAIPAALYRREALPWEAVSWRKDALCNTGGVEVHVTCIYLISTKARTQP